MRIPPNQVLFLGQHQRAEFDRLQRALARRDQDIALAYGWR
jgi:hypothetical protein